MKITRPKAVYATYRRLRCSKYAQYHLSTTICLQLTHGSAEVWKACCISFKKKNPEYQQTLRKIILKPLHAHAVL